MCVERSIGCVFLENEREGRVYRDWECVQRNRENVYCVVIAKMCRERKESERVRER